jgi:hypothetical protein
MLFVCVVLYGKKLLTDRRFSSYINPLVFYSIAWVILMLELIFEVSVRPKDYSKLVKAERAYSPTTVRYINGFHLVFEFVALMFAIPDFLPLFNHRVSNGTSFIQAAINASYGKTNYQFIGGHLIFMLTRMRVFGLGKEMALKTRRFQI